LRFVPCTLEVAELAARHFAEYLERGGRRGRVVADFLIGAHAKLLADRLLTTDLGFRRDYFADLTLILP
jgi:predicted nucleic acid-binding protein